MKAALVAMLGFLTELVAHKRRQPADDLLSDLIAVRDTDGDRLSEDELMSVVFLVLFAGMENTTHLIGNAIHTLLRHPEHLALLRDDPSRLPAAVAELARLEGPALLAIRRFPTEDVTIAGVTVPAGETVLLSLSAANRDPARFSQPDTLDFDRDTSGHLALGHGIHYCLGGPLARVETEIALAALLDRYPTLELLESAPQWRRSLRSAASRNSRSATKRHVTRPETHRARRRGQGPCTPGGEAGCTGAGEAGRITGTADVGPRPRPGG